MKPMHGHYLCTACFMPTKCCEGAPCEIKPDEKQKEDELS